MLVGFYGFFRVDKINSLSIKDITVKGDHMTIYVAKRKNDQYQEGHTSYLVRSAKTTCPVAITEKLIKLLPQSCDSGYLLVSRIDKATSREYFHSSKRVSVTTLGD